MDGHAGGGGELLVADVALEVLGLLVLNEDLLVVEFSVAVVAEDLVHALLLLTHSTPSLALSSSPARSPRVRVSARSRARCVEEEEGSRGRDGKGRLPRLLGLASEGLGWSVPDLEGFCANIPWSFRV